MENPRAGDLGGPRKLNRAAPWEQHVFMFADGWKLTALLPLGCSQQAHPFANAELTSRLSHPPPLSAAHPPSPAQQAQAHPPRLPLRQCRRDMLSGQEPPQGDRIHLVAQFPVNGASFEHSGLSGFCVKPQDKPAASLGRRVSAAGPVGLKRSAQPPAPGGPHVPHPLCARHEEGGFHTWVKICFGRKQPTARSLQGPPHTPAM